MVSKEDLTIDFKNRNVDILGFGVSNRPLASLMLSLGANVTVYDAQDESSLGPEFAELKKQGVRYEKWDPEREDLLGGDYIFRTPGIRPDVPAIDRACRRGAVLSSEMELFFEKTPAKIIAVTGSDGKTTTTTLIGLILSRALQRKGSGRVFVGGNIGQPLLPQVFDMTEDDFAVVELSSFQLMTMKKSPHIAVITNITPNHLNWHKDMNEYIDAKKRICSSKPLSRLVLNADNPVTYRIGENASVPVTYFSITKQGPVRIIPSWQHASRALFLRDGAVWEGGPHLTCRKILDIDDIQIPGKHNIENYMAASAALEGLCETEDIVEIARSFPGVPHRLETVRRHQGVRYVNSSIDSTPSRTLISLKALGGDPIVIMGGRDKHLPYEELCAYLTSHITRVVLTGEAADLIEAALHASDPCGRVRIEKRPDFAEAVRTASGLAQNGDTVLLSPSCTSFDAFHNFEERGERFREIVNTI